MTKIQPLVSKLTIPAVADQVGVVRLAASGIASRMEFPTEAIEDIKVAVSEACTNAVQYAYKKDSRIESIVVEFMQKKDQLIIKVQDKGQGFDPQKPPKRDIKDDDPHMGLGITFIKNLMDEVQIDSGPKGTIVTMIKKLP